MTLVDKKSLSQPWNRRMITPIRQINNGNAICYLVTIGCQWRMLSKDFLPWQNVYSHYGKWCQQERWFLIHRALHQLSRNAANSQTAYELLSPVFFWRDTIQKLWTDGGYGETRFQVQLDIAVNLKAEDFQVLPKRWIAERTFACLSLDYQCKSQRSENMIYIDMIRLMRKRIKRLSNRLLMCRISDFILLLVDRLNFLP